MELKIISDKENPLFSRKEVRAEFRGFAATPARTEITGQLATHFKVDPACIHVQKIDCPYGGVVARVDALVYKDADALKKHTHPKRMLRGIKAAPKKK